jgi:hypothetical protein
MAFDRDLICKILHHCNIHYIVNNILQKLVHTTQDLYKKSEYQIIHNNDRTDEAFPCGTPLHKFPYKPTLLVPKYILQNLLNILANSIVITHSNTHFFFIVKN